MIRYLSVLVLLSFGATIQALPATHAYVSIPYLKDLVHSSWATELKQYKSLVDQVLAQEMAHDATHHVFYHAQKSEFRIVQDFLNNLYMFINPYITIENFYFLRPWYEFSKTIDANNFIDTYEMGVPRDWNDNKSYLSKRMLSVNFSLFGSTKNYGDFGECTFKYFFSNKSIKAPSIPQLLEEIFDYFGINKKYISELVTLNETIKTNEGSLFQIFIPINHVDTIAFAAQRLGTPYRNDLLMAHLFDYKKKRYPALTPILNVYCQNPSQFGPMLDRLQGRLLFSQDLLLNPLSGIKILRYTTVQPEKLENYQQKLKKITTHIFKSWLKSLVKGKIKTRLSYKKIKKLEEYYMSSY